MDWLQWVAALIPLDQAGHYIQWGWVQISVANFVVVLLMIITFVAALLIPFPGRNRRKEGR